MFAKDNKILELNEKVVSLRQHIFDLEEGLKEKDEVISVRTQAVGLASASIAAKGKDTLDKLEDTRRELRTVQDNWCKEQAEWRRERDETRILLEGSDYRVSSLQDAYKRLEKNNEDLGRKNHELLDNKRILEEEIAQLKSRSREEKILLQAKVEELEEEKMSSISKTNKKEEILQSKINNLEGKVRGKAKSGREGSRIAQLENALAEAEEEKGSLQLKLVDLDELTSNELKLKNRIKDAEETSRRIGDELDSQQRVNTMLESEKFDLMEAVASR